MVIESCSSPRPQHFERIRRAHLFYAQRNVGEQLFSPDALRKLRNDVGPSRLRTAKCSPVKVIAMVGAVDYDGWQWRGDSSASVMAPHRDSFHARDGNKYRPARSR